MKDESTPLGAIEIFSELEKAHQAWDGIKKEAWVLDNPTQEVLDTIRRFGGEINDDRYPEAVVSTVPARYCVDVENSRYFPVDRQRNKRSTKNKMDLSQYFEDWDMKNAKHVFARFIFPTTPYPVAVVEFGWRDKPTTVELRKARFKIQDEELMPVLIEIRDLLQMLNKRFADSGA